MSNTTELIERFESLQRVYKDLENEINRDEAVLDVKKEEVLEKRKELQEKGIKFKTLKELKEIRTDMEERIESKVSRMEEILGVDSDTEEEFDEFDDFDEVEIDI